MVALLVPLVEKIASPPGSFTLLNGVRPEMLTGEDAANKPGPPFCLTNMACGAVASSTLLESE